MRRISLYLSLIHIYAISTRDDIMNYLRLKGVPNKDAFTIMEKVRKGKGLTPEQEALMRANDVPDWYIAVSYTHLDVYKRQAGAKGDKEETIYEIADLAYHIMVMMVEQGIELSDVTAELAKRHVIAHKVKQERMK